MIAHNTTPAIVWIDGHHIFHRPDCTRVAKTAAERIKTGTTTDAYEKMLQPCRHCHPPEPRQWLDGIPVVPGRFIPRNLVEIICPFCGEQHIHGRHDDTSDPGLRASHCWRDDVQRGQYRIVKATGLEALK